MRWRSARRPSSYRGEVHIGRHIRHLYPLATSRGFVGEVSHVGDDVKRRLVDLLALEVRIEEALGRAPRFAEGHVDMDSAFTGFRSLVVGHQEALQARLRSLQAPAEGPAQGSEPGSPPTGEAEAPSEMLETLSGLFNLAAFRYSILHAAAHRHYDSKGEGNTADLAEKHLREYADAVRAINRLSSDVVVWELSRAGQECQCKCPSCGLGVCLCSPHGTNTVADVWRETATVGAEKAAGGLRVRSPRADSVASRAGLRPGDVIVAIDDQSVTDETWEGISIIQNTIGKHPPGEAIRFRVKRASGIFEEISVPHP